MFNLFLTTLLTMKLIILDDYDQTSEWAAKYIKKRIINFKPGPNKHFTLGLPTGKLSRNFFASLSSVVLYK